MSEVEERIKSLIGIITENLFLATERSINLEWHQNNGHNLYIDGKISPEYALLPLNAANKKELLQSLQAYNRGVINVRDWSKDFWIWPEEWPGKKAAKALAEEELTRRELVSSLDGIISFREENDNDRP
jgi:hypothetical protein